MKQLYGLLMVLLIINSVFGQFDNERKELIESEKKSASRSALDVNINPNTLNYDLQYVR